MACADGERGGMNRPFLPLPVLLLLACSSHTAPSGSAPPDSGALQGSPCELTTDCEVGLLCGFPIEAGCAAEGVCVPEDYACPTDGPTVCGCDGTPVGLACIYGSGYAALPVVNATPGCMPMFDAGLFD